MERRGALPSQMIQGMMEAGQITGAKTENINPASLDLSLSDEVYRVDNLFQPRPGEKVKNLIACEGKGAFRYSFDLPLERDVIYIAKLKEELDLPEGIYGYCNPKSTTGRSDVFARVIADGVSRYDAAAPTGYKGALWISIIPQSFAVKFCVEDKLSQIRFFNANTRFDELELQLSMEKDKLLWSSEKKLRMSDLKITDRDGSIILTAMVSGRKIGWHSLRSNRVANFAGGNPIKRFFEKINRNGGRIYPRKDEFYILSTREAVMVPPWLACEMVPMDERSGEFRSHYAGYIDPGWGFGSDGLGKGKTLTLEFRPFRDTVIRDGQPIAKIRFEKMIEVPRIHYDAMSSSNYIIQEGPRPAKIFA